MNELATSDPCVACGRPLLGASYGGVCASCYYEAALEREERVGRFALMQPLGEGGTAIVYVANDLEHDGLVALKIARHELLERSDLVAAFRTGLRNQQALRELPNIVNTYEIGTSADGRPYAAMPLLEGGTLQERPLPIEPRERIALLIKLARAVSRAHQRGILHCDIKPANVLFSSEGEPYLTDFGFARLLDGADLRRGAVLHGGTQGWMSPEQVRDEALTTASDVFSLGILIYWMFARELPFGSGDDFGAFARRVQHEGHASLGVHYTGEWSWELERICDRALQKDPERRYPTAADLAEDLRCVLTGESTWAERNSPHRRLRKWVLRHKLAAVAALQLGLLIAYLPFLPLAVVSEVRGNLERELGRLAKSQATAVMGELKASARLLDQLALDPEIHALIGNDDPVTPPAALAKRGFDGLSVFGSDGILDARWPEPIQSSSRRDYAFRDYYQGQARNAARGSRDVYVARTFYSTGDEEPMLGLSTPLYDGGVPRGALIGRTRAGATFGAMHMRCGDDAGSCTTALLGPRDRDAPDQGMPDAIYVLAAPGLREGQGLMLEDALAHKICARLPCTPAPTRQLDHPSPIAPLILNDYEDPLTGARSMAALAPVGETGLIVLVSTPNNALEAIGDKMTDWLKKLLLVQVALGAALLIGVSVGRRSPARST